MAFPVLETDGWLISADEQMGSKRKMWLRRPDGNQFLFKYPRPGFGEHWAEKAASEIAGVLGIPHAEVELATFQGEYGTICRSFMEGEQDDLYHGNQLLAVIWPGYDEKKNFGQSEHTYHRIVHIVKGTDASVPSSALGFEPTDGGLTCLAGYLVLDSLISNTDRHHENWALIATFGYDEEGLVVVERVKLAPTFDHASSLGRELSDDRRTLLLSDPQAMERYYSHCRSRIYWRETDSKPLHPVELVRRAAAESPELFAPWLGRVDTIGEDEVSTVFSSFPNGWVSPLAAEFAISLVMLNQARLREVHRSLKL